MRDRPKIPDKRIIAGLEHGYGLSVRSLEFLPIGNDVAAAAFRVCAGQYAYFLKLRRGTPNPAALTVPHHLRVHGVESVVAPLVAISGGLFAEIDDYFLILYPWIEGESKWGRRSAEDSGARGARSCAQFTVRAPART